MRKGYSSFGHIEIYMSASNEHRIALIIDVVRQVWSGANIADVIIAISYLSLFLLLFIIVNIIKSRYDFFVRNLSPY